MKYRFGIRLTIVMIVFAVAISFTIAITDYIRLREHVIQNNAVQLQHNELAAKQSLDTIEKAYDVFQTSLAARMKKNSETLLDLYESTPSFDNWDFEALKRSLSSDIYVIDAGNAIVYSSYPADVGLDFDECCKSLARKLNEIRSAGAFYHEGIDVEQSTGKLKKYSYMPTRDKKYVFELGYAIQDESVFEKFNFLTEIKQFVENSPSIDDIRVLNVGGYYLGEANRQERALPAERRSAFERALNTGQTTERAGEWNGEPAVYRYVQYVSPYDDGLTKTKILEIVYNENELQTIMLKDKRTFVIQLIVILTATVILSLYISRWVSKPIHLAFHDSLTGLKNRAAFDERLESAIAGSKGTVALLMIDLDNFKGVNDRLGHDRGDRLLICVAQNILSIARKKDVAVRWGGDEFALIMPSTTREEAEKAASALIGSITASTERDIALEGEKVTVSIGIALFPEHGADTEALHKSADLALYVSKEKGKNRYHVFDEEQADKGTA